MPPDLKPVEVVLTASSILLGFLFTGFWWALNRELRFRVDRRHFKLGYGLLLFSIGTLALAGVIMPLSIAVRGYPELAFSFGGIVVALVAAIGYMFTELGHYSVFKHQLYTTTAEKAAFWITIATIMGVIAMRLLRRL